jgi:DNA-binding CsgD family transcriptional regulator
MLGKRYFTLVQALHDSRSFDEVASLLSNQLPQQFENDHATIVLIKDGVELLQILGDSPSSEVGREHFDCVAGQLPKHPLLGKIDIENPGDLGFAASQYLEAGEYRDSEFNRGLPELMQANDSMAGRLANGWGRITLIFVCREEGVFAKEDRQVFDAVLFTARAVLERIGSQNLEHQFRKYMLSAGVGAPLSLFSMGTTREILPMNFMAIRKTEMWWGVDEPFRKLNDEDYARVSAEMKEAWIDPVVSDFRPIELDLGGGPMTFYGLPKAEGEVFLVAPIEGGSAVSSEEAVNAVLTKRQKEIMEWIAEGKTSAEAAIILAISPRTVEKHLEAVFQRLGVENRIAAVRRFLDLKAGLPV